MTTDTRHPSPVAPMPPQHQAYRELDARQQGWNSAQDREDALTTLRVWAHRVADQRAAVDDPCLDHLDVMDGLEDRVAAGVIVLPASPRTPRDVAVLCKVAARLEWSRIQRREMVDATACTDDDDEHPLGERAA